MPIIISKNGEKAVKVDKSSFDKEDQLQQYIYDNPGSIPLYDINEDIKLLILAREFSTNSGPIDAIGFDQDGNIYIVETKLYKNSDKRIVVAQALDYGASVWKNVNNFEDFLTQLNKHTQDKYKISASEKLQEYFSLSDEELETLLFNIKNNLSDGVIKFVILMDDLDSRLKDLILYVNQNSQFDIYAVQLEYYKHEDREIVIPRLYGAEVKKDINVSKSSSSRKIWTEETFIENAKQEMTKEEYEATMKIYNFSKQKADEIRFGTGKNYASFSPIFKSISEKSLFTVTTDGRLSLNFEWVYNDRPESAKWFKEELEKIGFEIDENYINIRPSVMPDVWLGKVEGFVGMFEKTMD
ncbi:hypothetical protein GW764_01690 [Candidatus Parcubacteria bacterium]|nr:hypothetical protein [Candidatus Parcubacteria bacterium]